MPLPPPTTGPLDGLSILRFAHAFQSGGGTERYLDDLDLSLLHRNSVTITRLHLSHLSTPPPPSTSLIGRGRLIQIPLPIIPHPSTSPSSTPPSKLRQLFRDHCLYHPLIWNLFTARFLAQRPLQPEPGQAINAGQTTAQILQSSPQNLLVLHFFGGSDAEAVLTEALLAHLPVALLNHYSNDRFLHLAIRKHTLLAHGIAGVNSLQVPHYLQPRFVNLSDGIDPSFFQRSLAQPLTTPPSTPFIFLPARIIREKGQLDLVHALASLHRSGIPASLALAGRIDHPSFATELSQTIAQAGLSPFVHFLGDLSPTLLRDWYAAATVVAFPTYHHEGLGRVILEAQAMETPVVAYATGGVPDAIVAGKTGLLIPTGNLPELTTSLASLLSSSTLRLSLTSNARLSIETHFSLSALAERHERFYLQVISQFSKRHP